MTSDDHALLNAIAAAPADDLPRLVYADWLEEHGETARAEFVRLQCEVAHLEANRDTIRPSHAGLWRRQDELLTRHRDELLGPLAGLPAGSDIDFDRGFVRRVVVKVADFLVHGAALDATIPRPRVRVTGVLADLEGFTRSPHLGGVTELSGYASGVADNLPALWDGSEIDFADAADRLGRLEVLDLEGCGVGDWFGNFFRTFHFPALVELDLSNNDISDVGVADLLRGTLPRRLILGGNPITDQGAFELADRLGPSAVEYLNLRGTLIGSPGHRAMLATFNRADKKVDLF